MLTRRMAKRQHCPLMPTAKIYEHHVNGVQINCEVIEYEKCTGEECRKWRDGKVDGGRCSYNGDCRKAVCNCASCPDRYGYCGG